MREKKRWLQKEWGRKGGCRRPRAEKMWLRQRSLGRKRKGNGRRFSEQKRGQHCRGREELFWEFWEKEKGLNLSRKLRTEERRVVGKNPGHGVEKGDFQVWPFVFFVYFPFFSYCPRLILSDFSFLPVGLFCFDDYWLNIGRACCVLCPILTSIFHLNSLDVGPMDERMKWVRYTG